MSFPVLTEKGTFVINGAERVIVSASCTVLRVCSSRTVDLDDGQRVRQEASSPARIIPYRGSWVESRPSTMNDHHVRPRIDRQAEAAR